MKTEISEHTTDPVIKYLTDLLIDARFDDVQPDGTLYCSDSNAALDPTEMAKRIREILEVPPYGSK